MNATNVSATGFDDESGKAIGPDPAISEYSTTNEWVPFTTDDDFYADDRSHGLIVYSQIEDPRPGEVVRAIAAIDAAYACHEEIDEVVPDGWV